MQKITSLLITLLLISSSSLFAQTFSFTAIPDEDITRLQKRFDQVATYLSQELKIQVKYIPVKSYSASVRAFKNDQVQLAWFGGLTGVQARRSISGSLAIAQGEEDTEFVTYFIAHNSTGLQESELFPKGIIGKTFTFGSKGSTSGRLMPEFFIRQELEKSPSKLFRRVGYSGNHSKTISLVQSGSYQVGAVNFKVWENHLKSGSIDLNQVKVIWKTPAYVDYNWSIRGDVDKKYGKGFTQKVQAALLKMGEPLLSAFPRKRFIEANNQMYQPIFDTGVAIGLFDQ